MLVFGGFSALGTVWNMYRMAIPSAQFVGVNVSFCVCFQHLGQCGMYRNYSLNTETDKSKV